MSNEAATEHIEPEELADYFEGVLPEDRNNLIEEHFAECDQCTAQARQFRAFSSRWNGWTAKVHREAYQRAVLAMALQAVERTHPHWRERLRQWQERWGGRAEAALRVIVERTEEASRVATESLEVLVRPGGGWQFALASATGRTPESKRPRRVRVRGAVPPSATATLAPGKPQERVTVSGEAREVQVHVDKWPPGVPPPLVLLIATEEGSKPMVKELTEEQAGVLIARFDSVKPGEYLVVFEPVA